MLSLSVRMAMFVLLVGLISESIFGFDPDTARSRYSLTKTEPHRVPRFVLDAGNVVDQLKSRKWGENAKELCEEWFPVLCKFLATEDWTPPEVVKLVIKKDLEAPGVTSGSAISISENWITNHPDDFGMVIHELVHVIQNYPHSNKNTGWLVEGIADYVRYWKYESERPRHQIGENANFRDGYSTTASFLAWIVWKYDRRIVRKLDLALRKGEYDDSLFREITGKDLPALWEEFLKHEHPHAK